MDQPAAPKHLGHHQMGKVSTTQITVTEVLSRIGDGKAVLVQERDHKALLEHAADLLIEQATALYNESYGNRGPWDPELSDDPERDKAWHEDLCRTAVRLRLA